MMKNAIIVMGLMSLGTSWAQSTPNPYIEKFHNAMPLADNTGITQSSESFSEKSRCITINEVADKLVTKDYNEKGDLLMMISYRLRDSSPCGGTEIFLYGNKWSIEQKNNSERVFTLEDVRVVLIDKALIEYFNNKKFCGNVNWKIDEVVPCDGKYFMWEQKHIGHQVNNLLLNI